LRVLSNELYALMSMPVWLGSGAAQGWLGLVWVWESV